VAKIVVTGIAANGTKISVTSVTPAEAADGLKVVTTSSQPGAGRL
jgi:hypothetical protein